MAATAKEHLAVGGKISWLANLDTAYQPEKNYRRSSIICTIGPKTNSVEAINALRKAGLNVVRMNFSVRFHPPSSSLPVVRQSS
jgi:pyruvate kinase